MRRHLLPLILLFGILFAGVYFILNTPWLLSSFVPHFVKNYLKNVELTAFDFKRQAFSFPDTLTLYQVKTSFIHQGITYTADIDKVTLYEVKKMTEPPYPIKISMEGLQAQEDRWQIRGADAKLFITFNESAFSSLEGIFRLPIATWAPYQVENVIGRIRGNPKRWEILDLTGNAYAGNLRGQLAWEYQPQLTYTLWIEASDIQAKEFEKTNLPLLSGCAGKIDGTFRLIADPQKISILDVNFTLPEGGIASSPLVQHLMNHTTEAEAQEALDAILESQGHLAFDKASVHIKNTSEQMATADIDLDSEKEKILLKASIRGINIKKTAARHLLPSKAEGKDLN